MTTLNEIINDFHNKVFDLQREHGLDSRCAKMLAYLILRPDFTEDMKQTYVERSKANIKRHGEC